MILLHAIQKGVKAPLKDFPKPNSHKLRNCPSQEEITETIGEYLQTSALKQLTAEKINQTHYWVPIFGRPKKGSTKVRLITDLRDLNRCHKVQQHHPQTWRQVVELTQDPTLQWAITLDLKAYYHHLALHPSTGRWMRMCYNNQGYQVHGMLFGWSMSSFWSHRLAKPIREQLT